MIAPYLSESPKYASVLWRYVIGSTDKNSRTVADISVGRILAESIYDADGKELLPAGSQVTAEFLSALRQRNISEVYLGRSLHSPTAEDANARTALYDPAKVREIEVRFQNTVAAIVNFAFEARSGNLTRTDEIADAVECYLRDSARDCGVVIATCMNDEDQDRSSHDEWLAKRSVRMSVLGAIVAAQMGMPDPDCIAAGIVGSLHDISLFGKRYRSTEASYLDHPFRSIEMLSNTFGISDPMKVIMGQVHEQCDGSGFPRRISSSRIHPVAKVLNVVDAFLAMTFSCDDETTYLPSDVLVYLVQHAIYDVFDRQCVKALLEVESVYPIGTRVILDDGSTAKVLRSNNSDYLRPVVMLEDGRVSNLQASERCVDRPLDIQNRYQRITRNTIDQVLWQGRAT